MSARARLDAAGMRDALQRHALDVWFPRCLDREHGGFLCDFDAKWRPQGENVKMLEFQARQTRVAALGLRLHPGDPAWREACELGWQALSEGLWDAEHGGWYWCTDRAWAPFDEGAKHAHGIAYAIHACLDVGRTLDHEPARALAHEGFAWLDAHAWDRGHGGYWGWMARDGHVYTDDAPGVRDHLGLAAARKSVNVAGDMVEALTELHRRDGNALTGERLGALVEHFEHWLAENADLPIAYLADRSAAGPVAHSGYAVQASWRLPLARAALGEPLVVSSTDREFRRVGRAKTGRHGLLVDTTSQEEWWMQFELLRSLVVQSAAHPDEAPELLEDAEGHLRRIERWFVDSSVGGVSHMPRRFLRPSHKGNRWKDASHESMAWHVAGGLLARPEGAPPVTIDEVLAL